MDTSKAIFSLSLAALTLLGQPAFGHPSPSRLGGTSRLAQLESESYSVGPLQLGMSQEQVRAALVAEGLDQPHEKGQPVKDEATGQFFELWQFSEAGLELSFSTPDATQPGTLATVILSEPSAWETYGLKAGMPEAEARKLLAGMIAPGVSAIEVGDDEHVGVLFEKSSMAVGVFFLEGKVASIYLGPGPE